MSEKKFKFKLPGAYVIMSILIIAAGILTWIIPAGVYDSIEINGRQVLDAASFHYIEQTPAGPWDLVLSVTKGLSKQSAVIFMCFICCGAFGIINKTKALDNIITRASISLRNKLFIVIPVIMALFWGLGIVGTSDSIVAFIPLGILIAHSLGADAMVGIAITYGAMNLGFTAGAFSAATTGTAQNIIGLPVFSGAGLRAAAGLVLYTFGCFYVIRYIQKVRKNPAASPLYGIEDFSANENIELPEITNRMKMVPVVFLLGVAAVVHCAVKGWGGTNDIAGIWFVTGIACGIVGGLSIDECFEGFVEGMKEMTFGGILIGFAAAIGIVLTDGNVIHTIVHACAQVIGETRGVVGTLLMFLLNLMVNFFIPSGPGQAGVVIPILSPLGDVLGITQQTVALAFNFGDGLCNSVIPTSNTLMACLGVACVTFDKWFRFFIKWFIGNCAIAVAFLIIANLIGYGPF